MSWLRIDDQAMRHPKVLRAVARRGPAAIGVWVAVLCHCALTGGILEDDMVPLLLPGVDGDELRAIAQTLADVGLLDRDGDAYLVHDWDHYQGEEATIAIERRREADRQRAKRYRDRRRGVARPPTQPTDDGSVTRHVTQSQTSESTAGRVDARHADRHVTLSRDANVTPSRPRSDPIRSDPGDLCDRGSTDLETSRAREAPPPTPTPPDLTESESAVLVELRRHPALSELARPEMARALWGAAACAGRSRADVEAAIRYVAADAAAKAADGLARGRDDLRDHLSRLVTTWRGDRHRRPAPQGSSGADVVDLRERVRSWTAEGMRERTEAYLREMAERQRGVS